MSNEEYINRTLMNASTPYNGTYTSKMSHYEPLQSCHSKQIFNIKCVYYVEGLVSKIG